MVVLPAPGVYLNNQLKIGSGSFRSIHSKCQIGRSMKDAFPFGAFFQGRFIGGQCLYLLYQGP